MPRHLHGNEDVPHLPYDLLDKSPEVMAEAERIAAALKVAAAYGGHDDSHKMWVIDQMVRVLTGCPLEKSGVQIGNGGTCYTYDRLGESDVYAAFIVEYNNEGDGPDNFWDSGVAP